MSGYAIVGDGAARSIAPALAPNVRVVVERGLVVTDTARAELPDRALFLDGAYEGPPFIDNVRRHYALDHHSGVVRPFTLATCEQAAVLVALGLPLDEGEWRIYLNDPDLDALLAAWVLINFAALRADDHRLIGELMPLLRVEGNIDTYGLDRAALSGVLPRSYAIHKARLERLRAEELALRRTGEWDACDAVAYSRARLAAFDAELLGHGRRDASRRALVRRGFVRARKVAVLMRSTAGIYEVEEALRIRYGNALAIVVLDRGEGHVSILLADPFLPKSLTDVYPLLNAADGLADSAAGNVWGGAREIGGSPRRTGTALGGEQVVRLVARLFAIDARVDGDSRAHDAHA